MVCNQVRERLSEYLDDVLPIETKARVDEHLSVCPVCREELSLLRAVVRKLKALEPVSAPSGFLDEIHGRMDKGTWLKKSIRILFFPLRLKVSLHVAGAIVAALLIFSMLTVERTNQRFMSQSSVPKHEQPAIPADKAVETLVEKGKERSILSDETAPAKPSPARQERPAPASVGPRPDTAVEAKRPALETEKLTDEVTAVGGVAGQIGRVEVDLRVPPARFDRPPDQQANRKTDAGERRVASDLAGRANTEYKSDMEKRNAPLLQTLKALVEGCQGRILEAGYEAQSGKLHRLRTEIPTSQAAAFFAGLGALGEIPSTPVVSDIADTVQVLIHIIEAK